MSQMSVCTCGKWPPERLSGLPDGVALGGLFVPEAWMFAHAATAGTSFPPSVSTEEWKHLFGATTWRGEAHLVHLLAQRTDVHRCRQAFHDHWATYFNPQETVQMLAKHRVTKLRIPIPWNMFPPQLPGFAVSDGFVADPFAKEDAAFAICAPEKFLLPWLEAAAAHDIEVMLELHTFPGTTGAAFQPMSWALAMSSMQDATVERWLLSYIEIMRRLLDFVRGLSHNMRVIITGIAPSPIGMKMDAEAYSLPMYPGQHAVVLLFTQMYDAVLPLLYRLHEGRLGMPKLYAAIDDALTYEGTNEYLRRIAEWLAQRGVDPREKLVRARHLYALTWNRPFALPTQSNLTSYIKRVFPLPRNPDDQPWKYCCVSWASPPPRTDLLKHRLQTLGSPLAAWKAMLFSTFVTTFRDLDIENYYFTWDLPDACSAEPLILWQQRTFWSLKCVLRSLDGKIDPPGMPLSPASSTPPTEDLAA
jgi:hypothetical protein